MFQKDSSLTIGLRNQLIQLLREKKIKDESVLSAINSIPRHIFLDSAFTNMAYEDKALQIGSGQTISQPYTVAFQTELLQIQPRDKVLEIGTGSGYQACVLAAMGAKVFTLERQKTLYDKTSKIIEHLGFATKIKMFFKDGFEGLPTYAPFDKIIITCAAPSIPDTLVKQLKIGGIMVIPLETKNAQQVMIRLTKLDDVNNQIEKFGDFAFVPMLEGLEKK